MGKGWIAIWFFLVNTEVLIFQVLNSVDWSLSDLKNNHLKFNFIF